jgi:hypothetical protein
MDGLKAIAGWVGSFVTWKQAQTAEKKQEAQRALTSLMLAARETRHHLAAVRANPASHSDEVEQRLATLWANAASDMFLVDGDLAGRYMAKSDYWSDPEGWTDQQKDDSLVKLDTMLQLGSAALLRS